jgi:actin-related protein
MGLPGVGVHKLCVDVVKRCNLSITGALFGSVVLAGGSTMFPKFDRRLQDELSAVVPDRIKTQVGGLVGGWVVGLGWGRLGWRVADGWVGGWVDR